MTFHLFITAIIMQTTLVVTSSAFKGNSSIPVKYTCEGSSINPPIEIGNLPKDTKSLVLIVDDPDAPKGTFDHWVMWNIPVQGKIDEDSAPGKVGKNGVNQNKYIGPCPPNGIHHYHFRVYAMDTRLELPEDTDKKALIKAMEGHTIAAGELIGLYEKKTKSNKVKNEKK